MFMKTLTAGVLAATLSLTGMAPTQAQASFSEEDAVVGIITLLLLGAAIHHSKDSDAAAEAPVPEPPRHNQHGWRVLPSNCLRHETRRNGNRVRLLAQRCMTRHYDHLNRLPDHCHVQFRNESGQRRAGWRARCLRNQGFRLNRP